MSILINGYTSSWSVAITVSNWVGSNNIRKIQIPSGYNGEFIFFSSPYYSSTIVSKSSNYGETFSTEKITQTYGDFSTKALDADIILTTVLYDEATYWNKLWSFKDSARNIEIFKEYNKDDNSRPREYFYGCAMNSDPFHPYDGTYGEYPDQWSVFGHTSGLAVGGRYEGNPVSLIPYDTPDPLGLGSNKIKYYNRDIVGANAAGISASFINFSSGSYTLIGNLPTTNTYVFGESGESLNDVDYNTDASTDPGVGYTTNNVYEARGTAKRICSSEDNSHQIVYYVDNVTYGTGFVLFNERNFVKKINIPPFTFSNLSVVDGTNNASIGMSYNGQIQAIGAGNKLYVSRNYGL